MLKPEGTAEYVKVTTEYADVRKRLVPLRLYALSDTGGMLNRASHFYHYEGGLEERELLRAAQAKDEEWKSFLAKSRPHVATQASSVWVEAPFVREAADMGMKHETLQGSSGSNSNNSNIIYELRRYNLVLGYDTVPTFLSHYEKGLPSKLDAGAETGKSRFCSLMYSEVGTLNQMIEIWRHEGAAGMEETRVASRGKQAWRNAIGEIAKLGKELWIS